MSLEERGYFKEWTYPRAVCGNDGYTYKLEDGTKWSQEFLYARDFKGGFGAVKVEGREACYNDENDRWTFVDEKGNLWKQNFKRVHDFSEGLASVQLDNGRWTFVDEKGNLWKDDFSFAGDFHCGFAPFKLSDNKWMFANKRGGYNYRNVFREVHDFSEGLAAVKVYRGKRSETDDELNYGWTFFDGEKLWSKRFKNVRSFKEGLAAVQLDNGRWTFVDKNEKIFENEFSDVLDFHEGMAAVMTDDGLAFVDKNGRVLQLQKKGINIDKYVWSFLDGIAEVGPHSDIPRCCVDKEGRCFRLDYSNILRDIHRKPECFLDLPTERFNDQNFVEGATFQVKEGLREIVENKKEVDDDYAKYCLDTLNACKEKIERENEKIAEEKAKQERKLKLVDTIKDFKF